MASTTDALSGFTYFSGLDFLAPKQTLADAPVGGLDGNAAANRALITGIITFQNAVPNGGTFYVRWHDWNDNGTTDHFLGIDDVQILAVPTVNTLGIGWSTLDGGGGTSTGGVFAVRGTIGQPDAGRLTNGPSALNGGFWGIIAAVQTPGAPLLTITRTPTNTVAVSWPSPSTGFTLQQNTNSVSSVNWSNVVTAPSDNGTTKTLIVNPPVGNRFYRLFKP